MSVIQHLEKNYGTYVAEKGMFSIAESLFELAKNVGAAEARNIGLRKAKGKYTRG